MAKKARRLRRRIKRWLVLHPIRIRYRRWAQRDRRKRWSGSGTRKYAINRDGDMFIVECPQCHREVGLSYKKNRETRKASFVCSHCAVWISVYLEDGVVEMRDHRKGNIPERAIAAYDPGASIWRLGIGRDAPWWWTRRTICRDLQASGKDAHGHKTYRVVESTVKKCHSEATSPERAEEA